MTGLEDLAAWVSVVNPALFGGELMSLGQFEDIAAMTVASPRFFLAWLGQTPASVCLTLTDGGTATLEMVATLKEFRRRGLARAVIGEALRDLRNRGVRTVTLRAEPDAVDLYRGLGFTDVCRRVVAYYEPAMEETERACDR